MIHQIQAITPLFVQPKKDIADKSGRCAPLFPSQRQCPDINNFTMLLLEIEQHNNASLTPVNPLRPIDI